MKRCCRAVCALPAKSNTQKNKQTKNKIKQNTKKKKRKNIVLSRSARPHRSAPARFSHILFAVFHTLVHDGPGHHGRCRNALEISGPVLSLLIHLLTFGMSGRLAAQFKQNCTPYDEPNRTELTHHGHIFFSPEHFTFCSSLASVILRACAAVWLRPAANRCIFTYFPMHTTHTHTYTRAQQSNFCFSAGASVRPFSPSLSLSLFRPHPVCLPACLFFTDSLLFYYFSFSCFRRDFR